MKSRSIFLIEVCVAVAVTVLGLIDHDFLVITYSLCATLFTGILAHISKSREIKTTVSIISMVTLTIGSLLFLFVLNYTSEPFVDKRMYAHIEGLVAWIIAYPLAYLATECIVLLFNASLNRILVGGFMVFNSEALTSLMLIAISIFDTENLDTTFMFVDELAYLFMGLVMSLVAAVLTVIMLRGKGYLMSCETLEVKQ